MIKESMAHPMGSILKPEDLRALKPKQRHRYVQQLILHILSKDEDLTLSEIMEKTGLSRPTVARHIDYLVSCQQVLRRERGLGQIHIGFYKLAGVFDRREELRSDKDASLLFSFFVLENDDECSICIQQKEEDEYRSSQVKGAITIPFDDVKHFITYLNTYSARVIAK